MAAEKFGNIRSWGEIELGDELVTPKWKGKVTQHGEGFALLERWGKLEGRSYLIGELIEDLSQLRLDSKTLIQRRENLLLDRERGKIRKLQKVPILYKIPEYREFAQSTNEESDDMQTQKAQTQKTTAAKSQKTQKAMSTPTTRTARKVAQAQKARVMTDTAVETTKPPVAVKVNTSYPLTISGLSDETKISKLTLRKYLSKGLIHHIVEDNVHRFNDKSVEQAKAMREQNNQKWGPRENR